MSTEQKDWSEDPSTVLPTGFSLSSSVVSEESWEAIRSYLGLSIDPGDNSIHVTGFDDDRSTPNIPWESTPVPQNRPVVQFGFRYDYENDVVVADGSNVPEIPDVFRRFLLRPYYDAIEMDKDQSLPNEKRIGITDFTQCIVNVYRPTTTTTSGNDGNGRSKEPIEIHTHSSIPWHMDDPDFGPVILVFTFGEMRPLCMRLKDETPKKTGDVFRYFTAHPEHRSAYVLSGGARNQWEHSVPPGSGWRVSITFRTLAVHDSACDI